MSALAPLVVIIEYWVVLAVKRRSVNPHEIMQSTGVGNFCTRKKKRGTARVKLSEIGIEKIHILVQILFKDS